MAARIFACFIGPSSLEFGAAPGGVPAPLGYFVRSEYDGQMNTREMTEQLQDWQKRATETARNVGEATDIYVRENTWTTLAVAAVVGCMLGYLLASRRD